MRTVIFRRKTKNKFNSNFKKYFVNQESRPFKFGYDENYLSLIQMSLVYNTA